MPDTAGIVDYQPTELTVTARADMPLAALDAVLAAQGQMLPPEPIDPGGTATVGEAVLRGWSGPRRLWSGPLRDYILGCRLRNGRGEELAFGGRVMKNVAGFDVSRMLCGSQGALGELLDVTFKVLPLPEAELHRALVIADPNTAFAQVRALTAAMQPITGALYGDGILHLRASGRAETMTALAATLGGDDDSADLWRAVRQLRHPVQADGDTPLRRYHRLRSAAPIALPASADWLIDWAGALLWCREGAIDQALLSGQGWRCPDVSTDPAIGRLRDRVRHSFQSDQRSVAP